MRFYDLEEKHKSAIITPNRTAFEHLKMLYRQENSRDKIKTTCGFALGCRRENIVILSGTRPFPNKLNSIPVKKPQSIRGVRDGSGLKERVPL